MALPVSVLTRGQILDQALRRAGNTKSTVRDLAADAMNAILFDLYTQWDWPFLQKTTTISLVGSVFSLPTDFIWVKDASALFITQIDDQTVRQPVYEKPWETLVNQLPVEGIPRIFACDRGFAGSGGRAGVWPVNTTRAITANLRYQYLPTPLTTDAQTPTFPWATYLVQEMYVWALEYEGDPRSVAETQRKEMLFQRIRGAALPINTTAQDIPLDPTMFGPVFDGD